MSLSLLDYHKKDLALCTHPFIYVSRDVSLKFVEWLETMRMLGFDKVIIALYGAHQNVMKVFRFVSSTFQEKN